MMSILHTLFRAQRPRVDAKIPGQAEQSNGTPLPRALEELRRENERLRHEAAWLKEDLTLVREMLELRTLTDRDFQSPEELIREFLCKLADLSEHDRASLYLVDEESIRQALPTRTQTGIGDEFARDASRFQSEADMPEGLTPFACGGRAFPPKQSELWKRAECLVIHRLSARNGETQPHDARRTSGDSTPHPEGIGTRQDEPIDFEEHLLSELPIVAPFRSGLLIPVRHQSGLLGYLILTGAGEAGLHNGRTSPAERQLIGWAADYIGQTLQRTLERAQVEAQARRDALTQLANRHTFDQEFDRLLQQSSCTGQECSLILLDIDRFKSVNDTYGHTAGDRVIRRVGEVIQRTTQATRIVDRPLSARFGGEEFAIVLPNVSLSGAGRIAAALRRAIASERISVNGREIRVTVSAGVASALQNGSGPTLLLEAADKALYTAKREGRNRIAVADHASSEQRCGPA
jgi:diguanylate cyclase (GGDEF)-like protein